MKKRRLAIGCFILVACLVMGIGYAAIQKTLEIDNYVALGFDSTAYNAIFSAVEIDDANTSVNAAAVKDTNYKAGINGTNAAVLDINLDATVLTVVGHKVTVIATIQNDSQSYNVNLEAPVVSENAAIKDYVTVTCTLEDGATASPLAPGEEVTCTIVITLKALPTETITRQNIEVSIPHTASTYIATP